jgi:hypothetical protein
VSFKLGLWNRLLSVRLVLWDKNCHLLNLICRTELWSVKLGLRDRINVLKTGGTVKTVGTVGIVVL